MIEKWHIPISGFTQSINKSSGFDKLWLKLREQSSEKVSVVNPLRWRANFDSLAEFIFRMKNNGKTPDINIYAYSWGAGHGFISLSKELAKRGLLVRNAVLCDPIYHSWWRPWRAMMTGKLSPPIVIPRNVNRVHWFYQRQNTPQATSLKSQWIYTVIEEGVELKANHEWMDDQAEFHDKCLDVATTLGQADSWRG